MPSALNRVLFVLAGGLVAADVLWLSLGHFAIDARLYGLLVLLVVPLIAGSAWYGRVRGEPVLSALLAVAAFLIVFPAAASLLSYLLTTIAGPRIDAQLAAADQALGFDWPTLMALAARHPLVNQALGLLYVSVMPQTLVLLLALGWRRDLTALYGLSLALCFGAILTLAIWTAFPSFGAFSVFRLAPPVASKLGLVLGLDYAQGLVVMLKSGPGFISPRELRGIVGFPSYHTLQVLVLVWYARGLPRLRWIVLGLNLAVLPSIPVQGGHHLVDMLGGAAVTVAAVLLARAVLVRTPPAGETGPVLSPVFAGRVESAAGYE